MMMKRMRCATRRCAGAGQASPIDTDRDGNWQFQCPACKFWNLASKAGAVQATSPAPFDLDRLSTSLRHSMHVTRSPSGGV